MSTAGHPGNGPIEHKDVDLELPNDLTGMNDVDKAKHGVKEKMRVAKKKLANAAKARAPQQPQQSF